MQARRAFQKGRKGANAIEIVGEIVAVAIILFLLIWLIKNKFFIFKTSTEECEKVGGVCIPYKDSCTNRGFHDPNRDSGCAALGDYKCCRPWDASDQGYNIALAREYNKPEILIYIGDSKEPITTGKKLSLFAGEDIKIKIVATHLNERGNWIDNNGKEIKETVSENEEKPITFKCSVLMLDNQGKEIKNEDSINDCKEITEKEGKTITFKATNDMLFTKRRIEAAIYRGNNFGEFPEDKKVVIEIEIVSPIKIILQDKWSRYLNVRISWEGKERWKNIIYTFVSEPNECSSDINTHIDGVYTTGIIKAKENNRWTLYLSADNTQHKKILQEAEGDKKYLCVNIETEDDKSYSSYSQNRLKIDLTQPIAKAEFKPGYLTTEFSCEDRFSGCDSASFGYHYLSNIGSFISSLLTGVEDTKWCPKDEKYYISVGESLPYPYNELRVLCFMAKDYAGNKGYDIVLTYNLYSTLATLLKISQEGDCVKGGGVCSSACSGGKSGYAIGCPSGSVCCIG